MAALEPGAPFPTIALRDESGARRRSQRAGETLYAVFKTTCPTCELTWPFLDRIRKIAEGGPFSIVAVSQDDPAKTTAFNAPTPHTARDALRPRALAGLDALGLDNRPDALSRRRRTA